MNPSTQVVAASNKWLWAGRVVSALPALGLLFSAIMKLMKPPAVLQGFIHFGYPENLIVVIALLELGSTIIFDSACIGSRCDSDDRLSWWRNRH